MAEYEEKFIVLNVKRMEELNECMPYLAEHPSVIELTTALKRFTLSYRDEVGKPLNQKYYVVNQDESYAKKIIKIVLKNETKKEKINV